MSLEQQEMSPKRKLYFARRIPTNQNQEEIINIRPEHTAQDLKQIYQEKEIHYPNYIQSGSWTLRPLNQEGGLTVNNLPEDLNPLDVWEMVKMKIENSDIVVAIINTLSYGTILEAGYAAGLNRVSLYVLPDVSATAAQEDDLWFAFQASLSTQHLWQEEDFKTLQIFQEYGITNSKEYIELIKIIAPHFMKK